MEKKVSGCHGCATRIVDLQRHLVLWTQSTLCVRRYQEARCTILSTPRRFYRSAVIAKRARRVSSRQCIEHSRCLISGKASNGLAV